MAGQLQLLAYQQGQDDDDLIDTGGVLWLLYLRRQHRSERSLWTHDWLLRRDDYGAYETLLKELREEDQKSFLNFLRETPGLFTGLLDKVRPYIQKEDTPFRKAIPAGSRLAVTLRYLATGIYFKKKNYYK